MKTLLKTLLVSALLTGAATYLMRRASAPAPTPATDDEARADRLTDAERAVLLDELRGQL